MIMVDVRTVTANIILLNLMLFLQDDLPKLLEESLLSRVVPEMVCTPLYHMIVT